MLLGFAIAGQPRRLSLHELWWTKYFLFRESFPEGARRIHKGGAGSVRCVNLNFVLGKILGHF
jgi:hypothetical protein